MSPVTARVLLVLTAALWGLTFVANHELLRTLDPPQIVVIRFVGVSAIFGAMLLARPQLRPRFTRRDWGVVAFSGFLTVVVAQLALVQGQRYLAPALAGVVVATGPAIMMILSIVLLGEVVRARAVVGFVLAFGGAVGVIVLGSGSGTDLVVRNPWGAGLVVVAQIGWALYTVTSKPFAARQAPLTAVATAVIAGTVLVLPFLPDALAALPQLSLVQWLWLVELAVGGTVVPYLIYFSALRVLDANTTGAYLNLVPVFGIAWAAVVLGQQPSLVALVGAAVVIVGVTLTQSGSRAVVPPAPEVVPARQETT